MSGNRQFFFSILLLMLVPAAAQARDVPLNSLGTSAGQAQRRADGTMLLRPGATVRTDFAIRDGHGVTAQVERRDRCSTNLQVTARLGDQAASSPIGRMPDAWGPIPHISFALVSRPSRMTVPDTRLPLISPRCTETGPQWPSVSAAT